MLVVIVVAAATAFSFFVAAYQKQLQAEETLSHDRALEEVKVLGISEVRCAARNVTCASSGAPTDSFATLTFLVASLDVNRISIAGLFLNGTGVSNYTAAFPNGTRIDPCYNSSAHVNGSLTSGLVPCSPISLPSYSSVKLEFNLDQASVGAFVFGGSDDLFVPTSDITLQVLTGLANDFTDTFAPPSAVASVFFVSNGSASVPVFDGLNSYQPAGSDNATVLWYNWSLVGVPHGPLTYSGPEFEAHGLNSTHSYTVYLNVTNSDGLSGSTNLSYTQP